HCHRPSSDDGIWYQPSFRCLPFCDHRAIACLGDFDVVSSGLASALLEAVKYVNGFLKLCHYITRNQPSGESIRISLTPHPTSGNGRQSSGSSPRWSLRNS